MTQTPHDSFTLYDIELVVEKVGPSCTCTKSVGDRVVFKGGKLSLPPGKDFCLYALQSAIPLLPAKQRMNSPADWMETDAIVTCPDIACGLVMRIVRTGTQSFRHDDVSAIPWNSLHDKKD